MMGVFWCGHRRSSTPDHNLKHIHISEWHATQTVEGDAELVSPRKAKDDVFENNEIFKVSRRMRTEALQHSGTEINQQERFIYINI